MDCFDPAKYAEGYALAEERIKVSGIAIARGIATSDMGNGSEHVDFVLGYRTCVGVHYERLTSDG